MKKTASLVALIAIAGVMMVTAPDQANARLQYFKAFGTKYEKVKDEAAMKKCAVCHGGKRGIKKKLRSDYAQELAKVLEEKNVKDTDKINAAFNKVAKIEAGDGKTYGDLLEAGELPPPYEGEE